MTAISYSTCDNVLTRIVRMLWLVERPVYMRVCKHGCGVKIICFLHANHASTNFKKFLSGKLNNFIHPFPRQLILFTNKLCQFFCLSWHFKGQKSVFWKTSFLQNKKWLRMQDFVYKTLRPVRISLLISAMTKSFAFFLGKFNWKNQKKTSFLYLHSLI